MNYTPLERAKRIEQALRDSIMTSGARKDFNLAKEIAKEIALAIKEDRAAYRKAFRDRELQKANRTTDKKVPEKTGRKRKSKTNKPKAD